MVVKNKIKLNEIINSISRINKILSTFTSSLVYEQNMFFGELNKIYSHIILELIKEFKNDNIEDNDINELKDVIIKSGLLEQKDLYVFIAQAEDGLVEILIEDLLNNILRTVEIISIRRSIGLGMYFGQQLPIDLQESKQKVIELYIGEDNIKEMFIYEIEKDIYINYFVHLVIKINHYLYKINIDNEPIFFLNEYILYDAQKYLFINIYNNKEYSIKDHGNYDKLMDILIKNISEYVSYSKIEKESGMELFCKKISTIGDIKKALNDIKKNLILNVNKNLKVQQGYKLDFIKVSNGFKLSLK